MKKWMLMLAATMVMMVGCGKNECEQAADVYQEGTEEACKGKSCALCDCLKKDGDECKGVQKIGNINNKAKCEDEALTEAEKCLNDKTACKKQAKDAVEQGCKA